jgi:predicted nuclease of predicted toxin-antitoxin system
MRWERVPRASPRAPKPKFYLDESVGVWVGDVLGLHHSVQTAEQVRLLGRSDADQFAHCWRHGRVLVTHDYDFYDYQNPELPDMRNPGVIVLACDSGNSAAIQSILEFLPRLIDVFGERGWKHTRTIVGAKGLVSIRRRNRNSGADEVEHYRFARQGFFERQLPQRPGSR